MLNSMKCRDDAALVNIMETQGMPLPSRIDLQTLRTGTQMLALVRDHLQQDQLGAISDADYFSRSNPIIKPLVEEFEPLAHYVRSIDPSDALKACLSSPGSKSDGEIRDDNQVIETIPDCSGNCKSFGSDQEGSSEQW